jgi:hypothetical protein
MIKKWKKIDKNSQTTKLGKNKKRRKKNIDTEV